MQEGYASACIMGGLSETDRADSIMALRNALRGLLACTIDACSTGIDLTFGDVAVFVELTYEPTKLLQAEARLHRFGRHDPELVQYLIGRGSVDELVANAVIAKLDTFEAVMAGGAESLQAALPQ